MDPVPNPVPGAQFEQTSIGGFPAYNWHSAAHAAPLDIKEVIVRELPSDIQDWYTNGTVVFSYTGHRENAYTITDKYPYTLLIPQVINRLFNTANAHDNGTNPLETQTDELSVLVREIIDETSVDLKDPSKHALNNLMLFQQFFRPLGILGSLPNPHDAGIRMTETTIRVFEKADRVINVWGSDAGQNSRVGFVVHRRKVAEVRSISQAVSSNDVNIDLPLDPAHPSPYVVEPIIFSKAREKRLFRDSRGHIVWPPRPTEDAPRDPDVFELDDYIVFHLGCVNRVAQTSSSTKFGDGTLLYNFADNYMGGLGGLDIILNPEWGF